MSLNHDSIAEEPLTRTSTVVALWPKAMLPFARNSARPRRRQLADIQPIAVEIELPGGGVRVDGSITKGHPKAGGRRRSRP